jgi:chromosome segregation ATPase
LGGMGGAPLPPNVQSKLSEADAAKTDLESKISDLEKKLLEEREKVLLASLRSKEEEAVSAKVETSIKEIQDKLRREKREVELEESRRKAELRVAEMERRLAEEREAWVSTLKNQLNQRDQVTQEMETHFSARLKDLEYRWAQEKASLEAALREREGEVARAKQEAALKTEQEKGFWEDRLRTTAAEREKIERELERVRDRVDHEKAQLLAERQVLRDQVSKAEQTARFVEDRSRAEKEAFERQMAAMAAREQNHAKEVSEKAAQISALEQQMSLARSQTSQVEGRVHTLEAQLEEWRRRAADVEQEASVKRLQYEHQIEELRREMGHARALAQEEASRTIARMEAEFNEKKARFETEAEALKEQILKSRAAAQDDAARSIAKVEADFLEKKLRYDNEISNLREQLNRTQKGANEETSRVQARLEEEFAERRRKLEDELHVVKNQLAHERQVLQDELARYKAETESRIRTLQGRVDWYDANAKREYEIAREKVQADLEAAIARADTAEKAMGEMKLIEEQRLQAVADASLAAQRADEIRAAVQAELDQTRAEWKQIQWELETRIKEMSAQITAHQAREGQFEEGRVALEQELRQRAESLDHAQDALKQRHDEITRLKEMVEQINGELELERDRARAFQEQLDGYKQIMQGRGVKSMDELKAQLDEKTEALERAREAMARMANEVQDIEKKEELIREKERIYKQLVADKEEQLAELRKKVPAMESRLAETESELAALRAAAQRDREQMAGDGSKVQERVDQETERLVRQFKEEKDRMVAAQQEEIRRLSEQSRQAIEAARREADEIARQAAPAQEPEALEAEIRQRVEVEYVDRLKELEAKIAETQAAAKKEVDRTKWESDSMREELKRARETRAHIEREAQELLGQAEAHFKLQIERVRADATKRALEQKSGGLFSAIGRFLDSPVIEFGGGKKPAPPKKKVEEKKPAPKPAAQKAPTPPADKDKQQQKPAA